MRGAVAVRPVTITAARRPSHVYGGSFTIGCTSVYPICIYDVYHLAVPTAYMIL